MAGKGTPDLLRMQIDVGKAYDLLTMFKEAGKNRIDIHATVQLWESLPWLADK